MKKTTTLILVLLLLLSLLPVHAAEIVDSGTCGENLTWTLDSDGLLTISGTGEMDRSPWYYEQVKTAIIKNGVTSIRSYAFNRCRNLTSVTIPDSVTSIGKDAFAGCSSLTNVTIPDSVTNVGENAFADCSSLTNVTIPDSVTSIGYSAFSGCSGLTSVTIPDSVTSIGSSAFSGCSGLTSVTIPNSVTSIGYSAFKDCSSVTRMKVAAGNPVYHSAGNCIIETERKTLIAGCKASVIPSDGSVTSIGESAFEGCSGLTSISIPDSVTSIGYWAFCGCSSLTSVTIPDSVTSIGDWVFRGCSNLTGVTIPDSVTSIGDYTFEDCSSLTNVKIGNGVTSIESYMFRGCTNLTSVKIPDSVTSIEYDAFYGCSNLTSVTIPDSVTSIGDSAFKDCSSVTRMKVAAGNPVYHSAGNCIIETERKTLIAGCKASVIPSDGSVTSIGESAFEGCSGLTSISIPDSVRSIGESAFEGCSGLTSILIPDSVRSIGESAFEGCSGLTSVTIPDSVTSIGESAFYNCSSLTSVYTTDLAAWCTIIFSNSSSNPLYYAHHLYLNGEEMTELTIPDSVTNIGEHAFEDCTGLTSVTIPDSVTSIGYMAFRDCSSLTRVTIGNGVTSIGDWAFSGCKGITSINIPNSVTYIGGAAFSGCTKLTSIIIPDSVTTIGKSAFNSCLSLTSLEIGTGVTSIGEIGRVRTGIPAMHDTFPNCYNLNKITVKTGNKKYHSSGNCLIETKSKTLILGCKNSKIPADGSVTSIGEHAFEDCSSLTSVTIPDSVTSIRAYAFSNCSSLASIIIPANVEEIEGAAIPAHTVIYGIPGSYAQTWAEENNRAFVPLKEATVTLVAPAVVNEPAVPVAGFANPGAEVVLTVNGKAAGTAQAAANGRWSANLTLSGAKDGDSFTVKATVAAEGKTAEKTAAVTYLPDAVVFEDFTMSHSYYTANVRSDDRGAAVRNFTVVPGKAFAFRARVSNADRVRELNVVSTKNGVSKKLALTLDADSGVWLANGWFDDADKNYVPGVLTLEGVDKDGAAFTAGEFRFNFLIDPSGYAYEAVKSNVLADVTAAIYYKDAAGHELLWNAEPADQLNPVTTLPDGAFAWVVPEGQWQVRLTKDGYNEAESAWMDVPPEHTNVFIPMTRTANPTVKAVNVYADHADVIFDSYMELDSVTAETLTFAGYTGAIAPVDKTETEKGSGVFYATTFRFTPDKHFAGSVEIAVNGAKNYAEKEVSAFTGAVEVAAEPKNLTATETLALDYGKTAAVELNAENAAGKTVTVTADGAALTLDAETLTLDENGKATVTVTAAMPGTETLTFTLDGTTLTAKTTVTVRIPEPAPAALPGDVSGDGQVTAEDARLALRAAVGLESYAAGSPEFLAADATKDGAITAEDARLILRAAVGLETLG